MPNQSAEREAAWLHGLIEATQDALVTIDERGGIVLFNPAATRIFGYQRHEVIGRPVTMLMPEPYRSQHAGYIERYEATGEPRAVGRIRVVEAQRKTGERFPIELSVAAVEFEGEMLYGAFIRDISETVRLQEELVEQKRLAAVGETSATLAHEVGNPLNNMALTTKLLERYLRKLGVDDERVRAALSIVGGEIRRLSSLLDEFRSVAGRQRLDPRPLDVEALFDTLAREHLETALERGTEIQTQVTPQLGQIQADHGKLKQVFINLLKNALEAMPDGGVIRLEASLDNDDAVLRVTDAGTGIPAGIDIFEPFRTTKDHGTGLGLSIVRRVIRGHGGTVAHRPAQPTGTTFEIRLPAPSAAAPDTVTSE
ncbi:MAG: nitrogen regulation protein NR(II) [Sandaracinaceae bacterium]